MIDLAHRRPRASAELDLPPSPEAARLREVARVLEQIAALQRRLRDLEAAGPQEGA